MNSKPIYRIFYDGLFYWPQVKSSDNRIWFQIIHEVNGVPDTLEKAQKIIDSDYETWYIRNSKDKQPKYIDYTPEDPYEEDMA